MIKRLALRKTFTVVSSKRRPNGAEWALGVHASLNWRYSGTSCAPSVQVYLFLTAPCTSREGMPFICVYRCSESPSNSSSFEYSWLLSLIASGWRRYVHMTRYKCVLKYINGAGGGYS